MKRCVLRHVRVPFVVLALPVCWITIPFRARVREFGPAASTGGAQTPSSQTKTPLRRPAALGWPAAHLASLAKGPAAVPTPNHYQLAPAWFSPFLALEIPNSPRKTLRGSGSPHVDSTDVEGQSDVG